VTFYQENSLDYSNNFFGVESRTQGLRVEYDNEAIEFDDQKSKHRLFLPYLKFKKKKKNQIASVSKGPQVKVLRCTFTFANINFE